MEIVHGSGLLSPTLASELIQARESLSPLDEVGLALRADRRRRGESQREYAARRGWSKSRQFRLEHRPGELKFAEVIASLEGTGYRFVLSRTDDTASATPETAPGTAPVAPAAPAGIVPTEWPIGELIGRDRAGRRFPAPRTVRRAGPSEPRWWWYEESCDIRSRCPVWISEAATPSSAPGAPDDTEPG